MKSLCLALYIYIYIYTHIYILCFLEHLCLFRIHLRHRIFGYRRRAGYSDIDFRVDPRFSGV